MNSEKEQVQFSRFRDFLRKFKKQKTAIAALLVIVLLGVIAVVGERIAPFGIDEFDYSSILQGPSSAHWFRYSRVKIWENRRSRRLMTVCSLEFR